MVVPEAVRGIAVGYDGRPESDRALDWAVREARLRGTDVTICSAWTPVTLTVSDQHPAARLARLEAARELDFAVSRAGAALGRDRVWSLLERGPAVRVLCGMAPETGMVVVGSLGGDAIAALLDFSVATAVVAHARSRVVVIRGGRHPVTERAHGDVVVGYDGSASADLALDSGFEEARLHGARLLVVQAVHVDRQDAGEPDLEEMKALVSSAVGLRQDANPDVAVTIRFLDGRAGRVLCDAANGAGLLVVGSRGLGEVRGLLGSVSQHLIHHAPCPVMVVHAKPAVS